MSSMKRFTNNRSVSEGVRWFNNGDHPDDNVGRIAFHPGTHYSEARWEGAVVRYFRHPDYPGTKICMYCNHKYHVHGWIDQGSAGIKVCPGDWVMRETVTGEYWVAKDSYVQEHMTQLLTINLDEAADVEIKSIKLKPAPIGFTETGAITVDDNPSGCETHPFGTCTCRIMDWQREEKTPPSYHATVSAEGVEQHLPYQPINRDELDPENAAKSPYSGWFENPGLVTPGSGKTVWPKPEPITEEDLPFHPDRDDAIRRENRRLQTWLDNTRMENRKLRVHIQRLTAENNAFRTGRGRWREDDTVKEDSDDQPVGENGDYCELTNPKMPEPAPDKCGMPDMVENALITKAQAEAAWIAVATAWDGAVKRINEVIDAVAPYVPKNKNTDK